MGGLLLLAAFLAAGLLLADVLFRKISGVARLWLGLTTGMLLMMWLPSLYAYALRFSLAAQFAALGTALAGAIGAQIALKGCLVDCWLRVADRLGERIPLFRRAADQPCRSLQPRAGTEKFWGDMPWWLPAALVLPLLALSIYLQYTHILREVDGALHVGQSTYGDLSLHLGIATGLVDAKYPATYTLIQDTLLGYPFLTDALSASMLVAGCDLALSMTIPGSLMMGLVYLGFVLLAWEMTRRPLAVVLSFLLLFFNGGFGFCYVLDTVWKDPSALKNVFTGFYGAPANMVEHNIRWVNVVCDMLIPQRTFLGGWTMLIPALYMLVRYLRRNEREWIPILGVWAGAMPMIHTHSFLALALISGGTLFYSLFSERDKVGVLRDFGIYALIAAVLAIPQLLTWSVPQTVDGGSLALRFNWVNFDPSTGRLIDGYFWFWIKNVGLVYLLMVPAALSQKKTGRALALGALLVYCIAELIQFQPNEYDNNKLFYAAFLLMLPMVGSYLACIWDKLRGLRGRAVLAGAFLTVSLLSGTLSLARETVSDYTLFSAEEAGCAEFLQENTPRDAVFLTGDQHNNAVNALAGRQIVCGTGSYLYYHGIDYTDAYYAARNMLENPAENAALFEEYGVDYVYISNTERSNYQVDEQYFAENCEIVYNGFAIRVYKWEG